MSLIVETGSGSSTAESYQSVAGYKAWADARGYTYGTDALIEQAARRATSYIDSAYLDSFPGLRTHSRSQALEWPRSGVTDREGNAIDSDEIPSEIIEATNEAMKREIASPGSLSPDIKAGGGVAQRVKAGSVEVEFANTGTTWPTYPAIGQALSSLLIARSSYSGRVVRG